MVDFWPCAAGYIVSCTNVRYNIGVPQLFLQEKKKEIIFDATGVPLCQTDKVFWLLLEQPGIFLRSRVLNHSLDTF